MNKLAQKSKITNLQNSINAILKDCSENKKQIPAVINVIDTLFLTCFQGQVKIEILKMRRKLELIQELEVSK